VKSIKSYSPRESYSLTRRRQISLNRTSLRGSPMRLSSLPSFRSASIETRSESTIRNVEPGFRYGSGPNLGWTWRELAAFLEDRRRFRRIEARRSPLFGGDRCHAISTTASVPCFTPPFRLSSPASSRARWTNNFMLGHLPSPIPPWLSLGDAVTNTVILDGAMKDRIR